MSLKHNLYIKKLKVKRKLDRVKYGNCTVLLYHRVINATYDPQLLSVSPKNFKAQLSYLKQHYNFLTIEQFNYHLLNKKGFPKNSLIITFDDGYADNLLNAIPILEELNLQAFFYVATKNLNTALLFWWDELDLLFKDVEKMNKEALDHLLKTNNKKDVWELYEYYLNVLKRSKSLKERESYLDSLRKLRTVADSEKEKYVCMTFDQVKKLSSSSAAIVGAHTVNHLSLAGLSEIDQQNEIAESISKLSEILGEPIDYFSYPYGERQDFSEVTINICREMKLKHVAANYGGYMDSNSDPFAFTRFVVRNDLPEELHKKLKELL